MTRNQDVAVVRELAKQVAEIAALPVQEEKRSLWRKLNALKPQRPMVMIDQVCWNEMHIGDELKVRSTDPDCKYYEWQLRAALFQWRHFGADFVIDPFINVVKAVHNSGFGMSVQEETRVTDPTNGVVSHKFENQFKTEDDLAKLKTPVVTHDVAETARRMAVAEELFGGILPLRPWGYDPYLSLWDPIAFWMGVENALYAIVDQPELMHKLVAKLASGYMTLVDQLEAQGHLTGPQSWIHCTGAYTDQLPAPGYTPDKPRTKDIWMMQLAQMLATVSPEMFQEYEVEYTRDLCARYGMVYYGCCDPLDKKMKQVRMIPNVRKVSMSPWTDQERGAAEIGGDFVFSRKPNPALLAATSFDAEMIRKDLLATRDACRRNGCPLEFILKDISTVCYQPQRLFEWSKIAMEVACG